MTTLTNEEVRKASLAAGLQEDYMDIPKKFYAFAEAILAAAEAKQQGEAACKRCHGSGWVVRDPDIGTDQECFVCDGTGKVAHPPKAEQQGETSDKGPWSAGVTRKDNRVFIESDDFEHDVRLYVDGNFGDVDSKYLYACGIARQLNARPPKAEKAPDVSVQWLAEMVMSDCGCSTNNQRLLERITERIEQHIRANTPPKAEKAQDFELPAFLNNQLAVCGYYTAEQMREAFNRGYQDGFNNGWDAARGKA